MGLCVVVGEADGKAWFVSVGIKAHVNKSGLLGWVHGQHSAQAVPAVRMTSVKEQGYLWICLCVCQRTALHKNTINRLQPVPYG